ncbi:WXG100 family type VII secretion target [Micromonospora sp. DT233]|uniref:WXG100 family type VII secretion target n=1 Tax=Micromonospora sp. DT233 TaxID=3393432 RepID=UPI003CF65FA4
MANYQVNPVVVLDQAEGLLNVTRHLTQSLENLQNKVELFKAANQGQAPDAYAGSQKIWEQGQIKMNQTMTRGVLKLQAIVAEYQRGDKTGAGIFGG